MTQFEKLRQLEFMQRQVMINQNKYIMIALTLNLDKNKEQYKDVIELKN